MLKNNLFYLSLHITLDRVLVASWSRILMLFHILLCSIRLSIKSSEYFAHFTSNGDLLIRLLMNSNKIICDTNHPCDTPCPRTIFFPFLLSTTTLARRLCRYDLNVFPAMLYFFNFRSVIRLQPDYTS